MKNKSLTSILLLFVAGIFVLSGCDPKTIEPDTETVKSQAKGAYIVSDAFAVANNHNAAKAMLSSYPDCVKSELTLSDTEQTITLSFDNCEFNGATRTGKIILKRSKTDWIAGATYKLEFDKYTVDSELISGSIEVEFLISEELEQTYKLSAKNMKATSSSNNTDEVNTWSSNLTVVKSGGLFTPTPEDDEYKINGNGSGVNTEGEKYTTLYNNVVEKGTCKWPVSGTVTITKEGADPIEIDFDHNGKAECDNIVKVTQAGITVEVSL